MPPRAYINLRTTQEVIAMKYIDADKLKAEIERRRLHFNKEAEKYQALNNGYSQNCYGARDALRDLENFLDTLSEEPDKSLAVLTLT